MVFASCTVTPIEMLWPVFNGIFFTILIRTFAYSQIGRSNTNARAFLDESYTHGDVLWISTNDVSVGTTIFGIYDPGCDFMHVCILADLHSMSTGMADI
jgi:hypothetical protein